MESESTESNPIEESIREHDSNLIEWNYFALIRSAVFGRGSSPSLGRVLLVPGVVLR